MTGSLVQRLTWNTKASWLSHWSLPVAFWVVLLAIPLMVDSSYVLRIVATGVITAIFVTGINLKVGLAGLFSVGDAAFYGVGAYATALITVDAGWNPWLGVLLAMVAGTVSGYLVGAPILRLKTHYLAFATLGVNLIFIVVITNWVDFTHGAGGVIGIPSLSVFGLSFEQYGAFIYLAGLFLALSMALTAWLRRGRWGRAWRAIRDAESAAALMGVNTAAAKRRSFAVSGGIMALAGALFAHSSQFVSPDQFGPTLSVLGLSIAVIGGLGGLYGPVVAAIVITALPDLLRFASEWYLLLYGAFLYLLVVLLDPGKRLRHGRAGRAHEREAEPDGARPAPAGVQPGSAR